MLMSMRASWVGAKCSALLRPVLRQHNASRSSRCCHCCFAGISERAISERIERSQLRKTLKLSDREWSQALAQPIQIQNVERLLRAAQATQGRLQNRVLDLTFRQVDAAGAPIRQAPSEVAAAINLPEDRCERLLRAGIKATPMPGDAEPVEVLWEDEWLIAVNKPPFLNSTPMHRHVGNSMVNRLITHLGEVPKVLHRLDMDTSGVLIFSKCSKVTAEMHRMFRAREINKQYIAICVGTPRTADSGSFSEYIEGSLTQHERMTVNAPVERHPTIGPAACLHPSGKRARTFFDLLDSNEMFKWEGKQGEAWFQEHLHNMQGACVLRCQPLTGRTHQIRLHLAAAGYPIVGDTLYGLQVPQARRQALHASALTFQHPVEGRQIKVVAPVPPDMQQLLSICQLTVHDM